MGSSRLVLVALSLASFPLLAVADDDTPVLVAAQPDTGAPRAVDEGTAVKISDQGDGAVVEIREAGKQLEPPLLSWIQHDGI